MAIFVKINGHRMSGIFKKGWKYVTLTKLGQHVKEMMAVAVKKFLNF